jgi:hypothetical protein
MILSKKGVIKPQKEADLVFFYWSVAVITGVRRLKTLSASMMLVAVSYILLDSMDSIIIPYEDQSASLTFDPYLSNQSYSPPALELFHLIGRT